MEVKKMVIKFPNGEDVSFEYGKPVILLGANGAGKTRFCVKIEESNDSMFHDSVIENEKLLVHRISAQKSLTINDSISILDNESARKDLFYGGIYESVSKYGFRFQNNPATYLLDDYNKALSLLFSQENLQLQKAHMEDKQAEDTHRERPKLITTAVERATSIWNEILPHRKIDLSGNGVHIIYNERKYHGKEMSDGERVMLYMICQALVVRENSLLIIDEPELHIHKAIVNKLWSLLEQERPDCVFMYVTHDLNFALTRNTDKVFWIKAFDGEKWDYASIKPSDYSDIPTELLYEIIGSRQKILFVEGTKDSYDTALYRELYKDYHVIPCGSCQNVIRFVKSKNGYASLNSIEVKGIIDRDYRSEREIKALLEDDIYCLDVAEVENLFVVPELLDIMESVLLAEIGSAQNAKNRIISLYNDNKENQIAASVNQEIKYQLSLFDIGTKKYTVTEIKQFIDEKYSIEKLDIIVTEKREMFDCAINISQILKVFNLKNIANKIIGSFFGIGRKDEYPLRVLRALRKERKEEIINAIKRYIPNI